MDIKERFLNYVSFDTQSDPNSGTHPSSKKQFALGELLVKELHEMGIKNAYIDEYCYVYAFIPSNCHSNKTVGLIAHMDTASDASGKDIKPRTIDVYAGLPIVVNEELNIILDPKEFPRLNKQIGHELIVTDGTTLLGADDKAGIAIIMDALKSIEMIDHPNIIITFTPDEEIGEGTDKFNFEYYKQYNCDFAYTLDGDDPNIINYENFNAASALVTIHGKSIHPGSAKNKMVNSIHLAMEFASMLPSNMTPECTEKYEGFNHITGISGSCEESKLLYIIRNHDLNIFAKQKETFKAIESYLNNKYGEGTVEVKIQDSYFNMKEKVTARPEVLEYINEALVMSGLNPENEPIRGGTDGARLSFNGIVTPNVGTGGGNFHGPYEYADVDEMKTMVRVIHNLLQIISEK